MSPVRKALLAALLAAASMPTAAVGETITTLFFDGFEAETPNMLNAPLSLWNITGSVDVLSAGNICGGAGGVSNCLDLDGTDPPGGTIETNAVFALSPGSYRLSFDLAGSQRSFFSLTDTVTVSVGGHLLESFTKDFGDPFETIVRDFMLPAADSVRLRFAHQGSDQVGLLLDNIWFASVVPDQDPDPDPNPQPVPEPSTMLLVAPALGWLGYTLGRRLWR